MPVPSTSFFSRASRWGLRPEMNSRFAKRIILTNILGFLFSANMCLSGIAFLFYGHWELALFTFGFALSELLWPILNRAGYYTLSRTGLLVSSNILGFCVSIALPGTGYNKGFYVMAGLPILLFELRERGYIVMGLLLTLGLYPLSEWGGIVLPESLAITFSDGEARTIGIAVSLIYILLIFLMFYFVSRENDRAEAELEEQRVRAFTSAKFAALGEMASGITHEINNPLTAINLHTQYLRLLCEKDDVPKEEALTKLDQILKTIHRIARIVESMGMISRDGMNDNPKKENLSRIVDDTMSFCSERFRQHGVKFTCTVSVEITLTCRSIQISQLLLNLLNNSFDAVQNLTEKWIALEAHARENVIIITVTDSGSGIPEAHREKIFTPFYTTKPAGKGTGLGLSLSSKIARDHGGTLTIDHSHPHTRFVIELPRT